MPNNAESHGIQTRLIHLDRAENDRQLAAESQLASEKLRFELSAKRWDEMAERARHFEHEVAEREQNQPERAVP